MGTNIHAFAHRLTALSMSCLASVGFIFCALSGFGCSFIQIQAMEGRSIGNAAGDVFENTETAYLGVQCLSGRDDPFYDVDESVDILWNQSRIFLYVGLALGSTTTLFAWLLGSCIRPTAPRWSILSIFSALSAVFQIPIFLVFESDNCNFDITRQTCKLSTGAYLNIVSVSIWIVMTIWVQCLKAPRWDEELDAWRVSQNRESASTSSSDLAKGVGEEKSNMSPEEIYGRIGGNETVGTSEYAGTPPRGREESSSLPVSPGNFEASEKRSGQRYRRQQMSDKPNQVTEDKSPVGAPNEKGFFSIGQWGRNRSKESNSKTHAHCEPPITTKSYAETKYSRGNNDITASIDKSDAVDTGRNAVNQSVNHDATTASYTKNPIEPGCHVNCTYPDGTRQEAHFPSLPNCCIGGMRNASEEEEESKFQIIPHLSNGFQMAGYDDYDDSDSAEYLVRKLRKEEKAAAARRAKRNMAPVASFEFVTNNSIVDRRKNESGVHHDVVIKDDVSEMSRGSGWASGVSEILDDTNLRHHTKSILQDLADRN